jgi:hypothetical protein
MTGGTDKAHMFDLNQYMSQHLVERLDESECDHEATASEE